VRLFKHRRSIIPISRAKRARMIERHAAASKGRVCLEQNPEKE
jgi:hypothetical protein